MFDLYLAKLVGMVWDWPVTVGCVFVGLFFTFRFLFIQVRCIPHVFGLLTGKYDDPNSIGHISHFQALSAAVSGTVGLGNIAGVALAVAVGGPGAIFWMWIAGFLGMVIKFIEVTLGVMYREENKETGDVRGGPMYYIKKGLGKKWNPLAMFFAIGISLTGLVVGSMFQANQAAVALNTYYNVPKVLTGILALVLGAIVIIGGIKRIGKVASRIVPIMCFGYMLGAVVICFLNFEKVPEAINLIVTDAFTGKAAAGGVFLTVFLIGIRRAIFSNEAGIGSAPIVYAAVKTDYPIREGVIAALEPFIDTLVVCTATALIIILSGFYGTEKFQAFNDTTINFKAASKELRLNNGWTIGKKAPSEVCGLRSFRDGSYALYFSGKGAKEKAIKFPVIEVSKSDSNKKGSFREGKSVVDGIRFSYMKVKGDMAVRLVDSDGAIVASLVLKPGQDKVVEKDSVTGEEKVVFKLENYKKDRVWTSAIIHFGDVYRSRLKESGLKTDMLHMVLEPIGNKVVWAFDRVQPIKNIEGIELTTASFDKFANGFGSIFITIAVVFFAFSTLITWSYYGETSAAFVFGDKVITPYKWLFVTTAFLGSIASLTTVINLADLMLGLVTITNLFVICLLSNKVRKEAKEYFRKLKAKEFPIYK